MVGVYNWFGGMAIGTSPSGWNAQEFIFDGTNAYAMTPGIANMV